MQVAPSDLTNGHSFNSGLENTAIPAAEAAVAFAGQDPALPAAASAYADTAGAVSGASVRRGFSLPRSGAPAAPHWRLSLWAFLGGSLAIAATLLLGYGTGSPWLMAPFGATCVLAFALPDSPLAQPRSIIGGHLVAALTGFALLWLFGADGWVQAVAVGLSIALMQQSRTLHAPAGATPLLVLHTQPSLEFLLTPVLSGSVLIVLVACLFHRVRQPGSYPKYWY